MNDDNTPGGTGKWAAVVLAPLMVVCCLAPILILTSSSTIVAWIKGISGWNLAIVALLAFAGGRALFQYLKAQKSEPWRKEIDDACNAEKFN